jgi:hypothetical protein
MIEAGRRKQLQTITTRHEVALGFFNPRIIPSYTARREFDEWDQ